MTIDRLLYHTPLSCSRVVLNALEEIGLPYREQAVALMQGAHYKPEFLAINPKAKVPVLVEDDTVITELPVIVFHLSTAHPEARLLPTNAGGGPRLDALSDLVWIAGALHPMTARIFRPEGTSVADAAGVKSTAISDLGNIARMMDARIGAGWWYGPEWTITDMFIAWIFSLAEGFDFPLSDYPALADHRRRAEARPSFASARRVELVAAERDGITMPPGMTL